MKKFLVLLFVVFVAFILINRERVFVRDPLASVTRNGIAESGTQVFINYTNDVLLENDNAPMYVTLIEARTPQVVGIPVGLKCVHWTACLADAYPATLIEPATPTTRTRPARPSKSLTYTDAHGKQVVIKLRAGKPHLHCRAREIS